MQNPEFIWNADLYLRLSKDDKEKDEATALKISGTCYFDFVSKNPAVCVANILSDDGFTGANFDRTAFKEMISHIEQGSVNCHS